MNILIVDFKSSENYDFNYMESHSLGGTESTILRVARELAREHSVYISQLNRTERYAEKGITYIHHAEGLAQKEFIADIVIIRSKYRLLTDYRLNYPKAKMFVWAHNFQEIEILGRRHRIIKTQAKVICVSQSHRDHIDKIFNGALSWFFRLLAFRFEKVPVTYIYNVIDSAYTKTDGVHDKNKLFYFSTPNKGLKEVLNHFSALLKKAPNYHLYIAGATLEQLDSFDLDHKLLASNSVTVLGRLPKSEIISHLRSSFCVFYPQHVHAETFGLVYVEANCVGTPVLVHRFGAAAEVITNTEQFVDGRSSEAVVNKMLDWQKNGRPEVSCLEKTKLSYVVSRWKEVLGLN